MSYFRARLNGLTRSNSLGRYEDIDHAVATSDVVMLCLEYSMKGILINTIRQMEITWKNSA